MSHEEPIVDIKAVNIKGWVMSESGVLKNVVIRHVLKYRRKGWSENHWESVNVEEEDEKNENDDC